MLASLAAIVLVLNDLQAVIQVPVDKFSPPETVESYVRLRAEIGGVDPDLAALIAKSESGFNPLAKNPRSSAKGLFQFVDGTWQAKCDGDVFNPIDNTRCFVKIAKTEGLDDWRADVSMQLVINNFLKNAHLIQL